MASFQFAKNARSKLKGIDNMEVNRARIKQMARIQDQILTSSEAIEILGFTRQRLNIIVKEGRINPIKKGVYFKDEIMELKKKLEDARKEI